MDVERLPPLEHRRIVGGDSSPRDGDPAKDGAYGAMAQLDAIARQVSSPCELVSLAACGRPAAQGAAQEDSRGGHAVRAIDSRKGLRVGAASPAAVPPLASDARTISLVADRACAISHFLQLFIAPLFPLLKATWA